MPLAPVSFTSRMVQSLYLSFADAADQSRPLSGETSPLASGRKVSLRVNGCVRVRTSVPESAAVSVTLEAPAGAFLRLTSTVLASVRVSLTAISAPYIFVACRTSPAGSWAAVFSFTITGSRSSPQSQKHSEAFSVWAVIL